MTAKETVRKQSKSDRLIASWIVEFSSPLHDCPGSPGLFLRVDRRKDFIYPQIMTDDETSAEFDRIYETTKIKQNPGFATHNIGGSQGVKALRAAKSKKPKWRRELQAVRSWKTRKKT
jgi:hypothetical protein